MRRVIGIAMVVFGLNMAITGIWNFFSPFNTIFYIPHAINACIFGALAVIHVILNRKPLLQYFKRLGGRWVLFGILFFLIIYFGIILPIFFF